MLKKIAADKGAYLVHPSVCSAERPSAYERYELLGDKALGLCMTELLLERYPHFVEGELSRMVNMLVSKRVLAHVAQSAQIHALFSYHLNTISVSVYASMCEVVVAAVYRDYGWDALRTFVAEHWRAWLDNPSLIPVDYKTLLQEYAARKGYGSPTYGAKDKSGPDHACMFVCSVTLIGVGYATGSGTTKRVAEEEAVRVLCDTHGIEL